MATKRHRPEEIVAKLRQIEVLTVQGQSVAEAIRSIGVTEVSSGTSYSTASRIRRPETYPMRGDARSARSRSGDLRTADDPSGPAAMAARTGP